MSDITILSEKIKFKAELFTVTETVLRLKNGKKTIHHNVERHTTVNIFPLTSSYEIYLVSQYRPLLKKTTLEAVAGFIEEKETSLAAAKRELKEEAGLRAFHWEEIARIEAAASVVKASTHLFLAKGFEEGEQEQDEDEDITLVKIPLEEAVQKVITGEINAAGSMIGIMLLDRLRKEKKI